MKRWLSLVLGLVLVLSLMVPVASADDSDTTEQESVESIVVTMETESEEEKAPLTQEEKQIIMAPTAGTLYSKPSERIANDGETYPWYATAFKEEIQLNVGEEYSLVFVGCDPKDILFVPVFGTSEDFDLTENKFKITAEDVAILAFVPSPEGVGANIVCFYTSTYRQDMWEAMQPAIEECLGTPYVFGGHKPGVGLDCSAYASYVYMSVGLLKVPHTCNSLWAMCTHVDEPKVGDLVFFTGTYDTEGMSHVGIYAGNGMMYNSQNSGNVLENFADSAYWMSHLAGYGTMIGE